MEYQIKNIDSLELRTMKDKEGLILQGCGGDLGEWVTGINKMLTDEGILLDGTKFKEVYTFKNEGLTCLMFLFDEEAKIAIGSLAIWRLKTHEQFGGTWLSDYVENKLGGFIGQEEEPTEESLTEQTM